ncbi:MAG: RNA polymerase sigma factor [Deltaproteobacteria bacterium]|nr:RNA polymerase sigma factor [Deltaproteobacteria bacterium]
MDDATLIRHTLAGRREDFDILVERHQRALYAFVFRLVRDQHLTADIVQATFVRAYTRLAQFQERSSFSTWLHQIALNEYRARRRASRQQHEVTLEEGTVDSIAAPENQAAGWKHKLGDLIARLPLRQRTVLTMRVFGDMPFKRIAEAEGISENSAKVNYHHAVLRLRQWMKESEA